MYHHNKHQPEYSTHLFLFLNQCSKTSRWFCEDYITMQKFVGKTNTTAQWLRQQAKTLKLRVWGGGRQKKLDRITFGLRLKPIKVIEEQRHAREAQENRSRSIFDPPSAPAVIKRLFTWNLNAEGHMQPGW